MWSLTLIAILALFAGELPADGGARANQGAPPAPVPAGNDGSPGFLRGPAVVSEQPVRPLRTLIERNFDGVVQPIDGEPELAALRLLPLTPEQSRRLDSLSVRRTAAFDEMVRDRYNDLIEAIGALQAIEAAKDGWGRFSAIARFGRAWQAFEPWRQRGTLIEEMGDSLSDSEREGAKQLVVTYQNALAKSMAKEMGVTPLNPQVQWRLHLEEFGRLVQASFERQGKAGTDEFEILVRDLQLTPEQEESARVIFGDLALRELQKKATGWDRYKAFGEFMKTLTPPQKIKAWQFVRRQQQRQAAMQ